jgi:N-acetylmuramoyl-L-alanine amidase
MIHAVLLLLSLACVASVSAAPPRSSPTRSTGGAFVELQGIDYVSSTEFGRRFSLKTVWLKPGRRLALVREGMRIELEVDAREAEVNGLRVFLGEPPRMYRRTLYLSRTDADRFLGPIVQPGLGRTGSPIVRVIALDAGHGGRDFGKINARLKVNEKTFSLDLVQRMKRLLEAEGFRVVLTRSDDRYVELEDRPALAQKAGADLFVSVHFNSVENAPERVTGIEVFSLTPQYQYSTDDYGREAKDQARVFNPGNTHDSWNSLLAYKLQRQLIGDMKVADRGHKRQRFKVLRLALCPAALIEAGYLSNDAETRKIMTPAYRQDLAESIARGIKSYTASVQAARK